MSLEAVCVNRAAQSQYFFLSRLVDVLCIFVTELLFVTDIQVHG